MEFALQKFHNDLGAIGPKEGRTVNGLSITPNKWTVFMRAILHTYDSHLQSCRDIYARYAACMAAGTHGRQCPGWNSEWMAPTDWRIQCQTQLETPAPVFRWLSCHSTGPT